MDAPGPWKFNARNRDNRSRWYIRPADAKQGDLAICLVCSSTPSRREEHEKNAYLIAAAPELLKACKTALTTFDGPAVTHYAEQAKTAINELIDAIAKAEGTNED